MILISVKSEVVDDKRQFKSNTAATRFLKSIKRLHESHRMAIVGKKPVRHTFGAKRGSRKLYREAVKNWRLAMDTTLRLKVEIINTDNAQISLPL